MPDEDVRQLDLRYVGWLFIAAIVALISLVGWASVVAISTLSSPPTFLDEFLRNKPDLHASMAVTLEYQSYLLRTQGLQVAYGLLLALVFVSVGMLLFAIQAVGAIDVQAKLTDETFGLKASTPGIASILLGFVGKLLFADSCISRIL